MKNTLLLLSACASITLCGCGATKYLLTPTAVVVPYTNSVTGQVGVVTNTVYVPSPAAQQIGTVGNQIAPLIPAPFGTAVEGILALATLGLGYFAKIKTAQANTNSSLLNAVIAGVETGNSDATKAAVQSHAAAAGLQTTLDPIVQAITANMPTPPVAPPAV